MNATEDRENWATDGALMLHEQTVKAREMKKGGKSNAEIAKALGIPENNIRQYFRDEINWGFNCLTEGVYHGRPEALWNVPLGYAVQIFPADALQELVISRIHSDAMQLAKHVVIEQKGTGAKVRLDILDPEWTDRVKAFAEQYYRSTLQHKIGELSRYYNNPSYKLEIQRSAVRFRENKLNSFYEPLHSHDTINMLCRILGIKSKTKASDKL